MSDEALAVGARVCYWPGWREGDPRRGVLDSERTLLGGHTWGYYVRKDGGGSDFIAETHIEADDATPPLVAAPPVPPVVPDSEPLAEIPASMPQDGLHWYRRWLVAQQQLDAKFQREVSSGSGVVPDKPALAEAVRDVLWRAQRYGETADGDTSHYIVTKGAMHRLMGAAQAVGIPASFRNDDSTEVPEPVPAVTDDEAATKALAVALHDPDECRQCMVRKAGGHCVAWNGTLLRSASIISALRSAGFLIVHHTKET